jgi:primosomal protein N' (replication factor Y)
LHGVTGSGKTEIYMRAVDLTLQRGGQAIVLVPEIALTPQTVRRFAARFPGRVAVMHSGLNAGERYDVWRRARSGAVDIVIGARSAIFAPLSRLGLIVIDEEHDASYKQGNRPHYHAREAALHSARMHNAHVIMGSATPSLESYVRAERGEFRLLALPRRVLGHMQRVRDQEQRYGVAARFEAAGGETYYRDLPPVEIVDLRAELKAGNTHIFSRRLQGALQETLAKGEQAILFLNRRGAATFVSCRDCGHVLKCPRCETPLTYHESAGGKLICHTCNHRERQPDLCPNCGGARIRHFGAGTQKVEDEVRAMFPDARVLRWDRDTTRGRSDQHEEILRRFVDGQADVLVGTQMVTKGLDLPLVTLVGVVSADTALNLPDFRSSERTFQLLAQVAGRAGRGLQGGRAIVQTYRPDHYAIVSAADHDYAAFAEKELAFRREHNYPPLTRLARLIVRDADATRARDEAHRVGDELEALLARSGIGREGLIGPAPCFFARIAGQWRWHIVVRADDPVALLKGFELTPNWRVDVEPVSLL